MDATLVHPLQQLALVNEATNTGFCDNVHD